MTMAPQCNCGVRTFVAKYHDVGCPVHTAFKEGIDAAISTHSATTFEQRAVARLTSEQARRARVLANRFYDICKSNTAMSVEEVRVFDPQTPLGSKLVAVFERLLREGDVV